MNKDMYTPDYLKGLLFVMQDNFEDLGKWSTYNNDKLSDQIGVLTECFTSLKKLLEQCEHENTIDVGDAEHMQVACIECRALL